MKMHVAFVVHLCSQAHRKLLVAFFFFLVLFYSTKIHQKYIYQSCYIYLSVLNIKLSKSPEQIPVDQDFPVTFEIGEFENSKRMNECKPVSTKLSRRKDLRIGASDRLTRYMLSRR